AALCGEPFMVEMNSLDVAWRGVDDGTLVVHRTSPAMWHLNAAATDLWRTLAPPAHSGSADRLFDAIAATLHAARQTGRPSPRIRRVLDLGEVIAPIEL